MAIVILLDYSAIWAVVWVVFGSLICCGLGAGLAHLICPKSPTVTNLKTYGTQTQTSQLQNVHKCEKCDYYASYANFCGVCGKQVR